MALIDTPTQVVTVDYLAEVRASVVNERHIDIRPVGIYEGGFVTFTDSTAKVKPLVCEIRSNDGTEHQVRIETSTDAELQPTTDKEKFIVLRWTYSAAGPGTNTLTARLVELADINDYDLLVGVLNLIAGPKINGVSYYDSGITVASHYEDGAVRTSVAFKRTTPNLPSYKLKVEPDPQTNRGVVIREGWAKAGGTTVYIPEQRLSISSGAGFVYIDTDGNPQYTEGSGYGSDLILATVTTTSPVTSAAIVDTRGFAGAAGGVSEFAYGSVAGSDTEDRMVTLPFTPVFVDAWNDSGLPDTYWITGFGTWTKGGGDGDMHRTQNFMTISGNTITFAKNKDRLNNKGKTLYYIAFGGGVNKNPS